MIKTLMIRLQDRLEQRRRYRKLVAEIAALSQDDLIDMGAFQADLYRGAHKQVYG